LEVLVHYSALPKNHVITEILVPETLTILRLEESELPGDWDSESPGSDTQEIGERWVIEGRSAILSAPSTIIAHERNFVINPKHPDFATIEFRPSLPFRFDSRLKQ
jgi:RES domain-containing protein